MLHASLKGMVPNMEQELVAIGLNPQERAEQLTLAQFCTLARHVQALRAA